MITFAMSGGIGALSEAILTDIIPGVHKFGVESISHILFTAHIYLQFLGEVISPYAILMYSIVYSQIVKGKRKKALAYVLSLPMVFMIFFTDFHPDIDINFRILLVWSAPYFLIASFIMFCTWRDEINVYQREQKFRVFIVLVPAWLGVFIFNYVLRAIDSQTELFRIVPMFFFGAYIFFIGYIFLNGAFGIKVKVEQQQILDKSIQIMNGGTAVLNHTIKNEISKIKFFFNIAQNSIEKRDLDEAEKAIDSVFSAIEGIDNMVDRIRAKTEEIVLKESNVEIVSLLNECVHRASDIFSAKGIEITTEFKVDTVFYGDEILLKEVINNILNNAMEAITVAKGLIHIQMFKMKNGGISIEITDNGIGISKEELNRIMEPYFSTKKNIKNHGLGLSFCYNTIRAHDGELSVHSELGKGTSMIIKLPKSRVLSTSLAHNQMGGKSTWEIKL
ncbi:HAMP domain-containing histidine kinase [Priestia megaterium]|uniref:sensor histidine kinase n=1 Tax=Priestia megaterium TaxID=1404 RepID=UPI00228178C2|nr:HAMP domain-containing sensor histidine kinase [Priestia megaterium]MCY9019287.1 HAMP domain-containing histidine kinase [Priestia megaterium]